MPSLDQRIGKLETNPAFNWQAYIKSLTDDELLAIVGDNEEIDGVKLNEISDDDLDTLINAESDSIIREIIQTYKEKRRVS